MLTCYKLRGRQLEKLTDAEYLQRLNLLSRLCPAAVQGPSSHNPSHWKESLLTPRGCKSHWATHTDGCCLPSPRAREERRRAPQQNLCGEKERSLLLLPHNLGHSFHPAAAPPTRVGAAQIRPCQASSTAPQTSIWSWLLFPCPRQEGRARGMSRAGRGKPQDWWAWVAVGKEGNSTLPGFDDALRSLILVKNSPSWRNM